MSADNLSTTYNSDPESLDEIVFEHRNKEYGAYDLRKRYRGILTRAFIIGTLLFVAALILPFVLATIEAMNKKNVKIVDTNLEEIHQQDLPPPPKEKEAPPPPPPPPPKEIPKQEVVKDVIPEPKPNPKVEEPPKTNVEVKNTTTGTFNQEGVKTPAYTPPPPPPSTGVGKAVEVPKPPSNEVIDASGLDQQVEFPGGVNKFRSDVGSAVDTSAVTADSGETISTTVTFVVEKDGSITDIKASGPNSDFNSEAVRAVKSLRVRCTPGKVNGQPVRSRFRLPLSIQMQ